VGDLRSRRLRGLVLGACVASAVVAGACGDRVRALRPPIAAGGDPEVGRQLIGTYGCGSCHRIPGVARAEGLVGPPLDAMGRRTFIAGQLANTPENMVRWIVDPPAVEPGTAMPDLGVSPDEARQIAAYLATLD
jgi:cytochrome c